ncbi:hypothetical protein Pmi06nite_20820 [Planotetraspora mira]|uniref:NAD/GMP synthase domain-containing protein n=1 Tax=Planotetraspora mira TaxID=58121 RepID=A0A8J3X5L7_9ACTN|nr:hypothetical protein Pmi06nite_20820 [Planotetraspora mira]
MNDVTTAERTRRHIARDLGVDSDFDAGREIERRVAYLVDSLNGAGTATLVLAVSGGVDSATAGRLCRLAVEKARGAGSEAVFVAMRLPYGVQRDEHDAQAALAFVRPDRTLTVDIQPASDASLRTLLAGGLTLA